MTVREQLSRELEQSPDSLIEEILDFCLFLKQRQQTKLDDRGIAPKTNGILDLLESVKAIQAQVPNEEWNKPPPMMAQSTTIITFMVLLRLKYESSFC